MILRAKACCHCGKEGNPAFAIRSFYRSFRSSAIRDERWKLIVYPKIGHIQLFDLQKDPQETTNLIDRREYSAHVRRLLRLMKQWQAKVGDKLELPSLNMPPARPARPSMINLTGKKRSPDQWQPDWIVRKYFGESQ
ncbi:MAG: DUF4976 domain-containing protein [Acidobacteria bacterium]|nr:DUF4976 domain-containing protein [Acidobacteriota bacterium]